jgi:pimeloyl-ACP methyl ester carboxylesterase
MSMTALRVNGAELAYAEFGKADTIVVSAQQEFAPGGFLEQLAAPPINYHVFAIRLRRLSKADEGRDARPHSYPDLIIGGMYDPWVTPAALLRTARAVLGSKLVVYQDESHLLNTESSAKVIDEFKLFAANLAEQSRNTMATRT